MDTLDSLLSETEEGDGLQPLKAAAALGRKKLLKYRALVQEKEIYQFATGAGITWQVFAVWLNIATVFNPALKLKFFKDRPRFTRSWIQALTKRMGDVFGKEYAPTATEVPVPSDPTRVRVDW